MPHVQNKYDWVDVSKGIVICLMVIGHSTIPECVARWIWSFHMPFFFIISALYTSWEKNTAKDFIYRKIKVLLFPFIVYSLIILLWAPHILKCSIAEYSISILSNGWGGIALWFVPVFTISLIICKVTKEKWLIYTSIIALLIGCILSYYEIILPWTISSIPFGITLMTNFRRFQSPIRKILEKTNIKIKLILLTIGLVLSVVVSLHYRLDMASNHILPIIPIVLGIVGGSLFAILLAQLIARYLTFVCKIFVHIGRNTYEIMALSQIIIMTVNHYFNINPILKYLILIVMLISAVYIRKFVEGKFSKVEAI